MIHVRRWLSSTVRKFTDVDSLPIHASLKASLSGLGVSRLTRVQSETFAPIATGQSCVATARTGEGKTLSYLVPLVARMHNERLLTSGKTTCLISVPTRELCQQVGAVLVALNPSVNVLLAYGKPSASFQVLLRQSPHVIVGTGGRLASLVRKGDIDLRSVKMVVLDELDSLLMDDYRKEVTPLLEAISPGTQVVGFGATSSTDLTDVLKRFPCLSDNTVQIDTIGKAEKMPVKVNHLSVKVPDSTPVRISVLATILASRPFRQAIVFADSASEAKSICQHPSLVSRAKALHGNLPQAERDRVLNQFRGGSFPVLVCTDFASRGVDIPGVDLVVSFRPPLDTVGFVHRAGRTGRAGAAGESLVMYSGGERDRLTEVSSAAGIRFEHIECPSKPQQRQMAIDAVVAEAVESGKALQSRPKLMKYLASLSEGDKSRLVAACLQALLGSAVEVTPPPRNSILTGKEGFSPVLFVDPGRTVIKSRAELTSILETLNVQVGIVAATESGYVADIRTADAVKICHEHPELVKREFGVETLLLDKMPKLVVDQVSRGRKFNGVLPWHRKKASPAEARI